MFKKKRFALTNNMLLCLASHIFCSKYILVEGSDMAELVSMSFICAKVPGFNLAATESFKILKIFCFRYFELRSSRTINPEIFMSSVLTKNQYVMVYFSSNMNSRYNTKLPWIQRLLQLIHNNAEDNADE
jgi:hypothetical protein